MGSKRNVFVLLILLIPVLGGFSYYFIIRDLVVQSLSGNGSEWIELLAKTFYPRLEVETRRLPMSFFLEKADQVVVRFISISILTLIVLQIYNFNSRFRDFLVDFSREKTNLSNLFFLRILFYLLLIIATRNVYEDLRALKLLDAFYNPVLILDVLNVPFPPKRVSFAIYALLFLSSVLVIFGIRPVLFSIIAAFTFVLYQALLFSFEKIDHGYGPLTYCCMLFPFLLLERKKAKDDKKFDLFSWSLKLILIVICLVYFMAGLEKILISGVHWFSSASLKLFLEMHPTSAGGYVQNSPFLLTMLPILALLFQLSFPIILFFRKLKGLILVSGVLFHFGTVLLFGISSYENPWLFTYIFFIDWTSVGKYLSGLPAYFRT